MRYSTIAWCALVLLAGGALATLPLHARATERPEGHSKAPEGPRAKNAILFIGDGMGVTTVTAARIFAAGVDGSLTLDTLPYTAFSRTYSSDHLTADSAATMSAMVTGVKTNNGVLSLTASAERGDFQRDGDGPHPRTLIEDALAAGKRVGIVTTTRVTHATPAACYAHHSERDRETEIALQALPGDASYNPALGRGLDLLMGGGRRYFVPRGEMDEEGDRGARRDGRDLRAEFQAAGYHYVWNREGFEALGADDLPVLALFDAGHMDYEVDRAEDVGGQPTLAEMAVRAVELLSGSEKGFFLVVEGGRIDHAHHRAQAYRALVETVEFDRAIGAVLERVDPSDTLVVVTADHSHVFGIAGYPLRPRGELPWEPREAPEDWPADPGHGGLFDVVRDVRPRDGRVVVVLADDGLPYLPLVYGDGPGYRYERVDPRLGEGSGSDGPSDKRDLVFGGTPLQIETHGAEDVPLYALGPGAELVHGTVENTFVHDLFTRALGL